MGLELPVYSNTTVVWLLVEDKNGTATQPNPTLKHYMQSGKQVMESLVQIWVIRFVIEMDPSIVQKDAEPGLEATKKSKLVGIVQVIVDCLKNL